jgi:Reverse transcriptase (RNA-dependent DNA polymerase)
VPPKGSLSPLLWSFVIDNLLIELELQGYEVLGFADDLVIIVGGKVDSLISDRLQFASNYTTKWCRRTKLNINPRKTIVFPFIRRLKLGLKKPVMGRIEIEFSKETKYLRVVLDNKLRWDSLIKIVKERATKAFMACRAVVGQSLDLKRAMMSWIYTTVV